MFERDRCWAWCWALGGLWAAGSWACSGGAAEAPEGEAWPRAVDGAAAEPESGGGVRYQLVETPQGVSMEALTATAVHTFSCPRTCSGLCDECAASACQAAGELLEVCTRLVRDCTTACTCDTPASAFGCGFPVCTTDRYLCYVKDDERSLPAPAGPDPDPHPLTPFEGAARPANAGSPGASL